MEIFLQRIDSVPFQDENFSPEYFNWVTNLVDSLNETIDILEERLNTLEIPQATQADIVAAGPDAENGTMWYATDSVPPNVVVKIDGALRQLTTTAFP